MIESFARLPKVETVENSKLGGAMSQIKRLLDHLEETEKRFESRDSSRQESKEKIEEGDFLGANDDSVVRSRMKRLGMQPEASESIGTRSFEMPRPTRATGTRGNHRKHHL